MDGKNILQFFLFFKGKYKTKMQYCQDKFTEYLWWFFVREKARGRGKEKRED